MFRAIIIDDEPMGLNALKLLIERHTPQIKVVASSTDPFDGMSKIEDYMPDVVFLDISMPKMNAFELLEKIKFRDFKLVFTTAHQEYAIKAIKSRANDYLLKPIDVDELKICVENLFDADESGIPNEKNSSVIELHVKDGIIFIKKEEIIRLEASGSYTIFFLDNNVRHVASKNLKECESMLDSHEFFRCHPSHLVNLKKIVKMVSTDGLFAKMTDDSMPEIARRNKDLILRRLKSI
jgi:two-component system LytT family response regulator